MIAEEERRWYMNKIRELAKIVKEIEKCEKCKKNKIGKAVPGEGNPNAKIVFLGEAPGKNEAKTGRPFIGRSGKLLRKMIQEIELKEEEIFITSPVKRLPKYGTPKNTDIEHGKIHLKKQLVIIKPKLIVLLGNVAAKSMLSKPVAVMKQHGTIVREKGIVFFITLHPAAGLRFPPLKKLLEADFKILKVLARE